MNTWMEFGRMQKLGFFAAPPNFVYNNQSFGIVGGKFLGKINKPVGPNKRVGGNIPLLTYM